MLVHLFNIFSEHFGNLKIRILKIKNEILILWSPMEGHRLTLHIRDTRPSTISYLLKKKNSCYAGLTEGRRKKKYEKVINEIIK